MIRFAALAALALGGCSDAPQRWSRSDIEAIAADHGDTSHLEARIDELEERIAQMEADTRAAESNIDTLFNNDNQIESFANVTEDRVADLEFQLGR